MPSGTGSRERSELVSRRSLNRRDFLNRIGAAGAGSALLPFVPVLHREAEAAGEAMPRRLFLYITPNGTFWDQLIPSGGSETSFQFGPILKPLEEFKKKITVIEGADLMPGNGGRPHNNMVAHARANHLLTGRDGSVNGYTNANGGGISVDQVIAQRIGTGTPFRTVDLAVWRQNAYSFTGVNQPRTGTIDPRKVYKQLFEAGGGTTPATGSGVNPGASLAGDRRRVLDLVREHIRGIEREATSEERMKLQAHLAAVEGLTSRLDALDQRASSGASACSGAKAPMVSDSDITSANMYPTILPIQLELGAAALACDLTRVVTFVGGTVGNVGLRVNWLAGGGWDMHDRSHSWDRSKIIPLETWYATQFRDLLRIMDSIKEGERTLLDNSLVIWVKPMSDGGHRPGGGRGSCGASRCQAGWANFPIVMAGSAGGRLRTGRYLNFRSGIYHQRWLVSLLHAFGLTDLKSFGDPRFNNGPMPGLV
jgi:hypothetical protein